jgi:hypothetical protein
LPTLSTANPTASGSSHVVQIYWTTIGSVEHRQTDK